MVWFSLKQTQLLIIMTFAVTTTLEIYFETGPLHIYAYFVTTVLCFPLLIRACIKNSLGWMMFISVWWHCRGLINLTFLIMCMILVFSVECLFF